MLSMNAAVPISTLSGETQSYVLDHLQSGGPVTVERAQALKKAASVGHLSKEEVNQLLSQ